MQPAWGWTNYAKLAKTRRYVLLGLAVIAAILTPPDVVSQIMLLIPMYLLFELGIQVSRFVKPRRRQRGREGELRSGTTAGRGFFVKNKK